MKNVLLNLPTLVFIVGTRAALGVGIGMLAAQRLSDERRRRTGLTLAAIGAASTIPAIISVIRGRARASSQA